jgi:hypothetical protein
LSTCAYSQETHGGGKAPNHHGATNATSQPDSTQPLNMCLRKDSFSSETTVPGNHDLVPQPLQQSTTKFCGTPDVIGDRNLRPPPVYTHTFEPVTLLWITVARDSSIMAKHLAGILPGVLSSSSTPYSSAWFWSYILRFWHGFTPICRSDMGLQRYSVEPVLKPSERSPMQNSLQTLSQFYSSLRVHTPFSCYFHQPELRSSLLMRENDGYI